VAVAVALPCALLASGPSPETPVPAEALEFVYGGDAQFPPYEFLDPSGEPAGLNVDLIRAVARQQGLRVRVRLGRWTAIRAGLMAGEIDVAAMYRTPQRAREVDFAIAHEFVYHEMFVRRGSPGLVSLRDLDGKRVLVEAGTFSAESLRALGTCAAVLEQPSEPEALRALARGEGDVAVVTQAAGRPFHERSRAVPQVVPSGPPVLLAEYAFVTLPGRRQLLERLNAGVAAVKASGEYERLFARWLQPDRSAGKLRMVAAALLAALMAAALVALWNASLRRQVAAQTRALRFQLEEKGRAQAALASTERELRNAQRLESVGRVAGGMAHDFNNVLSVILSYAYALREALLSRGEATADVDEILSASERASRLTRQLLAFSRSTPVATVRLDLGALVLEMRSLLQRLVGEHVRVETTVPEEPVVIEGEATQLEQVLLNLAANARDAMPEGGQLELRVATRAFGGDGALPAGDYASVRVTDTGVGMDAATLARIFEPFFTTKEVGRGTGLGLATVMAQVRRLRGTVTVESAPGRGSTFEVLLPLSAVRELGPAHAELAPAPAPAPGPLAVLLVEDDEALRRSGALALQRAGHRVVEAKDGDQALELFGLAPFTVVVTDVVMPRRGGTSLVAELRRRRPGLLVLYVSGYVQDGQPLDLDAPGTAFLAKPYAGPALVEAVYRLVASEAQRTPAARSAGPG
jgi:signal transduction histidine kinase/ActR/RegA family two-component response regulator